MPQPPGTKHAIDLAVTQPFAGGTIHGITAPVVEGFARVG
jgi:hypothetical protein